MTEPLIDTSLLLTRMRRALLSRAEGADFLMQNAADELRERLGAVGRHFPKGASIHCLTSAARDAMLESGKVDEVVRVEPDPIFLAGEEGVAAPPDELPLAEGSLDLAVSLLWLQYANDIPGLLAQIRRALRPDGLFLAALAGGGTLSELRDALLTAEIELYGGASPRVLPFAGVRDAGQLLQRAGFALPVADVDMLTVRYDSLFALMADLRRMGATNTLISRTRRPSTRELFVRAADIYAQRYSDADGRIRATFAIVWLSGWAPHASQQKPLRPGTAAVPLVRALKGQKR